MRSVDDGADVAVQSLRQEYQNIIAGLGDSIRGIGDGEAERRGCGGVGRYEIHSHLCTYCLRRGYLPGNSVSQRRARCAQRASNPRTRRRHERLSPTQPSVAWPAYLAILATIVGSVHRLVFTL